MVDVTGLGISLLESFSFNKHLLDILYASHSWGIQMDEKKLMVFFFLKNEIFIRIQE